MARKVSIGVQDFEKIRTNNYFYIDKTDFIRQWWESADEVTLITRPRRFGKTLNMSMLEKFFSVKYAGRSDLFEGLSIWQEKSPEEDKFFNEGKASDEDKASNEDYKYRRLQGTYPVIFLSFADVKETSFLQARKKMCRIISELYNQFDFLLKSGLLNENERNDFTKISADMEDHEASFALKALSGYLSRYYHKKVLILLDEYDTPMQEAYVNGYWEEMAAFTRSLFNSSFKTNPYLERAIMTGITRISKESIFSDLNNLQVVSTTSEKYADCFGFIEEEVFTALEEFNLSDHKEQVKNWYDGFIFGNARDIYNPWSIINYLDKRRFRAYWANTSSNSLVGKLIREGAPEVKIIMEDLLQGKSFRATIDEQIIFSQLDCNINAVWSLLLASGYLKVEAYTVREDDVEEYELTLTNGEVRLMFRKMIDSWFAEYTPDYNAFVKALLRGDKKEMNIYMNRMATEMFSSFDSGTKPSEKMPERFCHGFVLGLMVDLSDKYVITSNRESGFGRYDIMLEPRMTSIGNDGIIIEFKVQDEEEKELSDTVRNALRQIEEKDYQANLIAKGIPEECIRKYGFAFCGKKVLIEDNITMPREKHT